MGNLTTALVFVMALNVIMFIGQASVLGLNPDANTFFTNKGQILNEFDKNKGVGEAVLETDDTYTNLPSVEGQVSPQSGNWFSDIFTSIKSWFAKTTGGNYIIQVTSAPYNMLKAIGLPNSITFALGGLWYGITFFLLVAWAFGRDG